MEALTLATARYVLTVCIPGARPLETSARRDAAAGDDVAALRVDLDFMERRRTERGGAGRFREGMSELNGSEWATNLHGIGAR